MQRLNRDINTIRAPLQKQYESMHVFFNVQHPINETRNGEKDTLSCSLKPLDPFNVPCNYKTYFPLVESSTTDSLEMCSYMYIQISCFL